MISVQISLKNEKKTVTVSALSYSTRLHFLYEFSWCTHEFTSTDHRDGKNVFTIIIMSKTFTYFRTVITSKCIDLQHRIKNYNQFTAREHNVPWQPAIKKLLLFSTKKLHTDSTDLCTLIVRVDSITNLKKNKYLWTIFRWASEIVEEVMVAEEKVETKTETERIGSRRKFENLHFYWNSYFSISGTIKIK